MVLYTSVALGSLFCGGLSYELKKFILAATTGVIRSFMLVSRVLIGFIGKSFPTVLDLYEKIKAGEYKVFFQFTFSLNGLYMFIGEEFSY